MNICPGCGGVLGRDCFNQYECQQIAASMNNEASHENESLRQQLAQAEQENKRLREALGKILSINAAPNHDALIDKLKSVAKEALKPKQ